MFFRLKVQPLTPSKSRRNVSLLLETTFSASASDTQNVGTDPQNLTVPTIVLPILVYTEGLVNGWMAYKSTANLTIVVCIVVSNSTFERENPCEDRS